MYHSKAHSSVDKEQSSSFIFSLLRGWVGKRGSGEADVRSARTAECQCGGVWAGGSEAVHGAKRQGESTFGSTSRGDIAILSCISKTLVLFHRIA